ncbi:MAG: hypothetical protein AB7F23_05050 [Phycisphaerae bacterium]
MKADKQLSIILIAAFIVAGASMSAAVTSKLFKFDTAADFSSGEMENVVVDSDGTMRLGRARSVLLDSLEDVWSINAMVVIDSKPVIGTSPNGEIFVIEDSVARCIYKPAPPAAEPAEAHRAENLENVAQQVMAEEPPQQAPHIINEHVFALAKDNQGRLVAGISGDNCRIVRFDENLANPEVVCKLEKAAFIFDIKPFAGSLYIATGPTGDIYKLSPNGSTELFCHLNERGITNLCFGSGSLYAGCDKRGVLYKIEPASGEAKALFDSDQVDITSVNVDEEGNVYVTAAIADPQADKKKPEKKEQYMPPHPEQGEKKEEKLYTLMNGGLKLHLAATVKQDMLNKAGEEKPKDDKISSYLYKIAPDGVVSTLGKGSGLFMDAALFEGCLWVGDGDSASLSKVYIDEVTYEDVYEDKECSVISALCVEGENLYAAMANPARVMLFEKGLSGSGEWVSPAIDAAQPSVWGELQLDAELPAETGIKYSIRSSNVRNAAEADYGSWTEPAPISATAPTLKSSERFLQVKLFLSGTGEFTPEVNALALGAAVRNIKPVVGEPLVKRENGESKITIGVPSKDENDDKLLYSIDLRCPGSTLWLNILEDSEENKYQWDSQTVPDGHYSLRATVTDKASNSLENALVSVSKSVDVLVDNTAPALVSSSVNVEQGAAKIEFTLEDEYTVIGQVRYTIDSDKDWTTVVPEDLLNDSKAEQYRITTEPLDPGQHIIALSFEDETGNKKYERFILDVK